MTMSSRPRVLTEQDAGSMDTLIRRGEQAATVAEQKAQQLQNAAADLEQVKGTIPAAAQSAATLATAQAKATLDAATLNATTAASQATLALATLPKFRSVDVNNPTAPTQAELDANPGGLGGTRLTADGATQLLRWTPHTLAGAWVTVGAPTATAPQVQEARDLAQQADGRAVEAQALAEQADTKAGTAAEQATRAQAALSNLTLTALGARGPADGPQLVDGSRWLWAAASPLPGGVVNGGTVVAGAEGVWVRETGKIWSARWFTAPGAPDSTARLQAAINTLPEWGVIEGFGDEFNILDLRIKSRMSLTNLRFKQLAGSVDLKSAVVIDGNPAVGAKSDILIQNVHINGNRLEQSDIITGTEDGGRHGFRILGRVTDLTITDSSAFDCASDGLELFSSDAYNNVPGNWTFERITVKRSKFNRNRRHGVSYDAVRTMRFEDCQFLSNGLDIDDTKPLTHGGRGSRFAGALYGNGADGEGYGNGSQCEDIVFLRCDGRYNARGSFLFLTGGDSTQPGYRPWQQITVQDCAMDAGVDPSSEGWCVAFTTSAAANPVRAYADVRVYNPTASGYVNFTSVDTPRLDGGSIYVPAPYQPVLLKYSDNAELGPVRTPGRAGVEAVGTTRWKATRDSMAPTLAAPTFGREEGQTGNLTAPVVSVVQVTTTGTLYRITASFSAASAATPYTSFRVTPGPGTVATIQTVGAVNNSTAIPCAASVLAPLIYVAIPAPVNSDPPAPVVMSVDVLVT